MAYHITDIRYCAPDSYPFYFFDANSWIAVLKNSGVFAVDSHEQPYVDLFEAIITTHTHKGTKQAKQVRHFPKIVVTSLLLSEIFNAYMRNVAMKVFYGAAGFKTKSFKTDYRPTPDYKKQIKNLTSDFIAFKDYIEIRDDRLTEIDPFSILPSLDESNDFNDFFYYYSFQGTGIPIVTHDSDYQYQDIPIITAQHKLLSIK